ncbi:MAG: hypothetical protein IKV73_04640, partial [Clostridia bacterium]|nr:hypothetical protein [Clostridia bacterium]
MLKIGWSRRDVSTEKPVDVPGQFYKRISKKVFEPVTLNCLVVSGTDDIAIFLSADFVNCDYTQDEIAEKIRKKRADIPTDKIIFNATHAHSAPNLSSHGRSRFSNQPDYIAPEEARLTEYFDSKVYTSSADEYRDFFTDSATDAIIEAFDNCADGAIAYGFGYAVVGHSRRSCYFDDVSEREGAPAWSSIFVNGHVRMYGKTNDNEFAGYEGYADHFINIMFTFDKNEKLTGAIINVPCPSQNCEGEYGLSADYWHDVRQLLRSKYGDIGIISHCAAAGDITPRILHYEDAEQRRFELKYNMGKNEC